MYRNISASSTKVEASAPKPKTGNWERTEVTVTAEVAPSTAKLVYSLVGEKLGCEIGASSGVVKIGDKPGTIKVRASDGGSGHFDEVSIEITERPKPPPEAGKTDVDGDEAERALDVPVFEEPRIADLEQVGAHRAAAAGDGACAAPPRARAAAGRPAAPRATRACAPAPAGSTAPASARARHDGGHEQDPAPRRQAVDHGQQPPLGLAAAQPADGRRASRSSRGRARSPAA